MIQTVFHINLMECVNIILLFQIKIIEYPFVIMYNVIQVIFLLIDEGGNTMAITRDMIIREILIEKPEAAEILMAYGMGCVGCPGAQMESLEEAAAVHGMNLDNLMAELNK